MEVEVQQAEASLLDLLVVVAENIKLLVLGSLLAGLLSLGVGFYLPQTFTSVAAIRATDGGKPVEELMKTRAVLSAAVSQWRPDLVVPAGSAEETLLLKNIRLKPALGQKTGVTLAQLEVDGDSPASAQAFANALIDAWIASTKPQPQTKIELERKLKISRESLDALNKIIERQTAESASAALPKLQYDLAGSLASLLQLKNGYVDTIAAIELQLKGVSRDAVFSPPTLPTEPVSNKKALIAVMSTLCTGFALLLFVFMRQAWRNAAQDSETAPKMARLRAAFGGRPRR